MDYKEKYEAALEQARKELKTCGSMDCDAARQIFRFFPELRESERIRKKMVEHFKAKTKETWCNMPVKDIIAYLEKQKEQSKVGLGKYSEEENLTYRLNWVMQDYYKAGEDDGEREHRFKCYKLFWDALEDENFFEPKKQNGEDEECTDFTIYHPLKNGKGEYECIPYSFYGSLTSFSEDKDLIDFLRTCFYTEEECNEWIEKQKEQKPAEWSEEDENALEYLHELIGFGFTEKFFDAQTAADMRGWLNTKLKSLRPQPIRTIFQKGYERAEKDIISLIETRIGEIIGDAQPAPILRAELRELIEKIRKN